VPRADTGVADAAVQLNHLRGVLQGGLAARGRSDRRGEVCVCTTGCQLPDRVPRAAGSEFSADSGIGESVFQCLKGPDRPAELRPLEHVATGALDGALGQHRLLDGEQREQARTDPCQYRLAFARGAQSASGRVDQPNMRERAGRVERAETLPMDSLVTGDSEKACARIGFGSDK
jgi:hypothetical protein